MICTVFFYFGTVQAQFTEQYSGAVTGVTCSSAAWGDYDNDGNLDILVTGGSSLGRVSKIYRNTGSGFTEVYAGSLTGVYYSSAAWGDYDNDGRLDILLTGYTGSTTVAKIYRNTGSGFSEVYAGSLTRVWQGCSAWGDYDNDGRLDILLTGYTGSSPVAKIFRNTGSGFTEVYAGSLTPVYESAVAWGDFDNDGRLDIFQSGNTGSGFITKIFRNTGSGFSEIYGGMLTAVKRGSVALSDYDNDGKLDILMSGFRGGTDFTAIYRNTGSGFTQVYAGSLYATANSSVAWGDYDNDGKPDILLTGYYGSNAMSKIYQNTGSGFTEVYAGVLTNVVYGSAVWGDYD